MVSKAHYDHSDSCDDDMSSTGSDSTGSLVDFIVSDASSDEEEAPLEDGGDQVEQVEQLVVQGKRKRKPVRKFVDEMMQDPAVMDLYMMDASPLSSDDDDAGEQDESSPSFAPEQLSSSETISSCSSSDADSDDGSMSRSTHRGDAASKSSQASKASKASKTSKASQASKPSDPRKRVKP